jgi:uncharacterized coiled-coil DUF342 family protein
MIIKNATLKGLLEKKDELVTEARGISKKIEELETERRKIGLQVQKVKDKVIPIVRKETDALLQEFEEVSTVEVKDGEIVVTTVNVLEDFKRDYKTAREQADKVEEAK